MRGNGAAPKVSAVQDGVLLRRGLGADRRGAVRRYRRLIESMGAGRVTIRTFDVSEAQVPLDRPAHHDPRAPLGLRGVRLSLVRDDLFQTQLRALVRAAVHGPLRIMFPFVSGVEELRAARALARAVDA